MKPLLRLFVLLLSLASLVGCSSVVTLDMAGQQVDTDYAALLNGEWQAEKGPVIFKDLGEGRLEIKILPKKKNQQTPPPFEVYLRHSGDVRYLNLQNPDDAEMPGYLFLRYQQREDGNLEAWLPEAKVFKKAVEQGDLKGSIEGSLWHRFIVISASPLELDRFLSTVDEDKIWDNKNPVPVYRKGEEGGNLSY